MMLVKLTSYIRRHHIALLALFFALGGASYAAATKLLPRNSVGTRQVIDHSLLSRDFKRGQLKAGARGPAGPRGFPGPQGPQGQGEFASKTLAASIHPTAACTNILSVTLPVPDAGTVVLDARATAVLQHTSGTADTLRLHLEASATTCTTTAPASTAQVNANELTASTAPRVFALAPELVLTSVTPGSQTYYLNADMTSGVSAGDLVTQAVLTAQYFAPAPSP
jgi:hypothetical protein